jgi:hypothetical protein
VSARSAECSGERDREYDTEAEYGVGSRTRGAYGIPGSEAHKPPSWPLELTDAGSLVLGTG